MSQSAGMWVAGDTGKAFRYTVTVDGVALDVTNASDIVMSLVRMASGSDRVYSISGVVVSPGTLGKFEWSGVRSIGGNLPSPASRQRPDVYEARVRFVLGGLAYWTEPFRVVVGRWNTDYTPNTTPPDVVTARAGDDLQPIVNALPSAGGQIWLGTGTFYGAAASPSTPLTIPSTKGVIFRGVRSDQTIVKSPILVEGRIGLEHLNVRPAGTAYGVRIFRAGSFLARSYMRHVFIGASSYGAGDGPVDGIQLDGAGLFYGEQVTCAFNTGNGLLCDSTSAEPNTTLKFDLCSFVQNNIGAKLVASMLCAEFNGGSMQDNYLNELYAEDTGVLYVHGVDFETANIGAGGNAVNIQNSKAVKFMGCNFVKNGGSVARAIVMQGTHGIDIDGNRFENYGTVGLVRLSGNCSNARVGVNQVQNGNGWIEDYSR